MTGLCYSLPFRINAAASQQTANPCSVPEPGQHRTAAPEIVMQCSFCPNPAAHPATGCVYGSRTIACAECVRSFWSWAIRHVNKRIKGKPDFYAAAGKWANEARRPL